jgi:hypothetical protein
MLRTRMMSETKYQVNQHPTSTWTCFVVFTSYYRGDGDSVTLHILDG